jgi:hypothetical protein
MNNIFRIDTGNTHGWQVRVQRNKKLHSRFFSDSRFPSRDSSRLAAELFRDELLSRVGHPQPSVGHLHTARAKRRAWEALTRTGIEGLGVTWQQEKSGQRYPYVQAHWVDTEGTRRASKRSVEKYGAQEATRYICRLLVANHPQYENEDRLYRKAIRRVNRLLRDGPRA